MKHFSKQTNKWMLSTLLVAALGSQYYFSTNSNNMSAVEFSSTAASEVEQMNVRSKELDQLISQLIEDKGISTADKAAKLTTLATEKGVILGKLKVIKDAELKNQNEDLNKRIRELTTNRNKSPNKTAQDKVNREKMTAQIEKLEADKIKLIEPEARTKQVVSKTLAVEPASEASNTEGKSSYTIYGCADCGEKGLSISGSQEDIMKIAAALAPKKAETAVATEKKKNEVVFETAAERREREKTEREEARAEVKRQKDEIADKKADKLRQEKDDRNDQFTEKAEEIADRCKDDLECKVSRFTTLMGRYTGKKKVDTFAVNKAYNQLVDKDLRAGLRGQDGTEGKLVTLHAIENLMEATPAEYKGLKTRAVDSTKAAQIEQAVAVNALYKQADLFAKQNKPTESIQSREQGFRSQAIFERDATNLYQSMYSGLEQNSVKDQTTMDYIRTNYVPDISKLLTQLTSSTGIAAADSAVLTGTSLGTTTTNGNRIGRGGNQTVINNATLNNNSGGVGFGAPSTNRVLNRTGLVK